MKKLLLLTFAILMSLNASALNELVQKMGKAFPEGDFYIAFITVPTINDATKNGDYSVFSEMDVAYNNYYEALNAQMLFDKVADQAQKLAFNSRVLGDQHYTTLTMKAIYNKLAPTAVADADAALSAIDDEFGDESWQYAAMVYHKVEAVANKGKIEDAYNYAKREQERLSATPMARHWLTGCLHIMQPVLLSNLQRWDEMKPGCDAAFSIWNERNKQVNEDPAVEGTCICAMVHLGNYISSIWRAFGYNKDIIDVNESFMKHLKIMEMDNTGLANEVRCNTAVAYWKEKNYKKSRPAMKEYLKRLEEKGEKGTPGYNYVENLLKQTPK